MREIAGKAVVITGASSGIGRGDRRLWRLFNRHCADGVAFTGFAIAQFTQPGIKFETAQLFDQIVAARLAECELIVAAVEADIEFDRGELIG